MLKQLTVAEARILKYAIENARKIIFKNGLINSEDLTLDCKTLMDISGINEIHRLDRELDHLPSMDLIGYGVGGGGFTSDDENLIADISPTALALNLYVRCQGHNSDPALYWEGNMITREEKDIEGAKNKEEKPKSRKRKQK